MKKAIYEIERNMLLRRLSAASQSFASKPMFAELLEDEFLDFPRAICEANLLESRDS